jgi:hypothetical protein
MLGPQGDTIGGLAGEQPIAIVFDVVDPLRPLLGASEPGGLSGEDETSKRNTSRTRRETDGESRLPSALHWTNAAPSSFEAGRFPFGAAGLSKKLGNRNPKGACKSVQQIHRRVLRLSFDAAEVGAIDSGIECKAFLRDALGDPDSPDIPRDKAPPFHAA